MKERKRSSRQTRKFFKKKTCRICGDKKQTLDYKESEFLLKFLTEKGKIIPRRISGNCAKHQRLLTRTMKKARYSGMVPFVIR